MDNGLKPCPFCGGQAEWKSGGPGCAYVACKDCPAETSDGSIPRIKAAWNARPDADALAAAQAENERLRDALRQVFDVVYNDNGDVTYDTHTMARAHKLARAALGKEET